MASSPVIFSCTAPIRLPPSPPRSPYSTLFRSETLLGKGFEVTVFDETVELARLTGTNREYLDREAPHIACRLKKDITEVVEQSEVVVITRDDPRFTGVPQTLREDQLLVDLAGVAKDGEVRSGYEGICW